MVDHVLTKELVMIKAKIEMNKHKGLIGINIFVVTVTLHNTRWEHKTVYRSL